MNESKNFNKYFNLYLIILFIFSLFYLQIKYNVGNDSTISEWLINYEGGFTKRGLIGQIAIYLSFLFDINLRTAILIFQIFIITIYYLLLSNFFKNLEINKIILLSIFTPLFILYPVAEIEVLARKEIFVFSFFLLYLTLDKIYYKSLYKIFILPILMLIWEPVIFFFTFWFIIDYIEDVFTIKFFSIIKYFLTYLPAVFLGFYIALNPITEADHLKMATFLKDNFNENCYMSCALLLNKSTIYQQFSSNFPLYSFEVFFRYSLIIIIGFGPLITLFINSQIKNLNKKIITLLILPPIMILFLMMSDWGRIVNIFYTFSIISFIYLYRKKFLIISDKLQNNILTKVLNKKKIYIIFFIIFSFGWNPKTSLVGDVGTNPLWKIPYNASKKIFGFQSFRIFQNNTIIQWHRKYIE